MNMITYFLILLVLLAAPTHAIASDSVEPQFVNHGVMAPVGQAGWGGIMTTQGQNGEPLILVDLWVIIGEPEQPRDKSLLVINARTGDTEQYVSGAGHHTGGFSTFLSRENRFYQSIGNTFLEFDVNERRWRHRAALPGRFANRFTADDDGTIYVGMFPTGDIVAYDPNRKHIVNHGSPTKEGWNQYPYLSTDDKGWVYSAVAYEKASISALNPKTGESRALLDEDQRHRVSDIDIFRGEDGHVYCHLKASDGGSWHRLYDGQYVGKLGAKPRVRPALLRRGWRDWRTFPDGSRLTHISIANRMATIQDVGGERKIAFDYESPGVRIYSMTEGPDGRIHGSTGIPYRHFVYDPERDESANYGLADYGGHVNDLATQGDKIYGALYSTGALLAYDPTVPWTDAPLSGATNPLQAYVSREARQLFGRPFAVIAHPDGEHIVVGGNPARGGAGGGMLIYNVKTDESTVLKPDELIPQQGIFALKALPDGNLVGGTTTAAGTGGVRQVEEAKLFLFDWQQRGVLHQAVPVPAAEKIHDLEIGPDGLVYGLADAGEPTLFVFDPASRETVHVEALDQYGDLIGPQAGRCMRRAEDGHLYILFSESIVRLTPGTFDHVAIRTPRPVTGGIVLTADRIYFSSGPSLWSYRLP